MKLTFSDEFLTCNIFILDGKRWSVPGLIQHAKAQKLEVFDLPIAHVNFDINMKTPPVKMPCGNAICSAGAPDMCLNDCKRNGRDPQKNHHPNPTDRSNGQPRNNTRPTPRGDKPRGERRKGAIVQVYGMRKRLVGQVQRLDGGERKATYPQGRKPLRGVCEETRRRLGILTDPA